jgi:hypothetical protein
MQFQRILLQIILWKFLSSKIVINEIQKKWSVFFSQKIEIVFFLFWLSPIARIAKLNKNFALESPV